MIELCDWSELAKRKEREKDWIVSTERSSHSWNNVCVASVKCWELALVCNFQNIYIYCAQKETHIFNVAISNELFD